MHSTTQAWRAEQRDLAMQTASADVGAAAAASSGPHRLEALARAAEQVQRAITMEVGIARSVGVSWQEVGTALNVSRQAAQQRYSLAPSALDHQGPGLVERSSGGPEGSGRV